MSEQLGNASSLQTEEHPRVKGSQENREIDLIAVLHVLWHKIWILILCFVVGAVLAGLGTKFFITPQYQSTAQIYIFSKSTSLSSFTDLQLGSQMAEDFRILGTTRPVIEQVIEDLNLNASYGSLVGSISITNPSGTHILKITVTNPDPVLAADISNALADVLRDQIASVMNTDRPSMVESAVVSSAPVSPDIKQNAIKGGIIFLALAVVIILLQYFMDDTIQTEEDVTNYLGLNTLAAIPLERDETSKTGKVKKLISGK